MPKSYRIRTTPGVNQSLQVTIDQEFDFLEILSLKILQSDIYTRQCSDYGVVVGRISINNGFGIPNAKVSVFIPLSDEDSENPIISELYPYKTTSDINDEGYRYNLLPYLPQYTGHAATGTFPEKSDVLINPNLIEVYDKYYKYTTTTNDSGDFMIFGVPVGAQTLFVDIDLSDIGEFSLTPKDLIRMGIATEDQVNKTTFKSSTDLNSLPQIVSMTRNIEVQPLWGQPDICTLGVNRTDFDLSKEAGIKVEPTSTFIGSILSDTDETYVKQNKKINNKMGRLCSMIAGPGTIKAVRQTINSDSEGRPQLEFYELGSGGQVIDEDGTWMIEVPMNLDYVITNEFGEQVISNDPSYGVPTKGKYRFRVSWNQSPSFTLSVRRASYLVPNIKEYGWVDYIEPNIKTDLNLKASYAFSTDWEDYGDINTTLGQNMINEAINCGDKFYLMGYNKVYTISSLITQYRNGTGKGRFLGIKDITDEECESDNYKFPTNDAQYQVDFLFLLYTFIMGMFLPMMLIMIVVMHVVKFLMYVVFGILSLVFYLIGGIVMLIASAFRLVSYLISSLGPKADKLEQSANGLFESAKEMRKKPMNILLKLCLITYPDCESCDGEVEIPSEDNETPNDATNSLNQSINSTGNSGVVSPFNLNSSYTCKSPLNTDYGQVLSGVDNGGSGLNEVDGSFDTKFIFSSSLTLPQRLNLFNTKGKYYNSDVSPGGGVNQIKVTFDTNINTTPDRFHLDNVICLIVDDKNISKFVQGELITVIDPNLSKDPNVTGSTLNVYGNYSITGSTYGNVISENITTYNRTINYANPNGNGNLSVEYTLTGFTEDTVNYQYPIDLEYFQVIQTKKLTTFITECGGTLDNSLPKRYLNNSFYYLDLTKIAIPGFGNVICENNGELKLSDCYGGYGSSHVVFLVRGVDPNTSKTKCRYDLSKLYGFDGFGQSSCIVEGDFHFNIPIQNKFKCVKHDLTSSTSIDAYSNQTLYYDSFQFVPGNQFSGFTSDLVKYYSSVDSFTVSNNSYVNNSNGLRISSTNHMTNEWNSPLQITSDCIVYTKTTDTNGRGYFINERIEGGSYQFLFADLPDSSFGSDSIFDVGGVYSRIYGTINMNYGLGTSGRQIVMRSDRLPSSSQTQKNGDNDMLLFENGSFMVYPLNNIGEVNSDSLFGDNKDGEYVTGVEGNEILDSFQCPNIIPLDCYEDDGNGNITIAPKGSDCYTNLTNSDKLRYEYIENGCYVFIKVTFLSMPMDMVMLIQWFRRQTTMYGLCRNIFSHTFTNNWVNGTLYMFPFKNLTKFDSKNRPIDYSFNEDLVYLNTDKNRFYYRSSPYTTDGVFIGSETLFWKYGNTRNLMFPTTIMDLGPRLSYLKETSVTKDFDGYIVDQLDNTTFKDITEILNYFVVGRLVSSATASVLGFFNSRKKRFVDGDYAQAISINSEVGVYPFDDNYYEGTDLYYYNGKGTSNNTMGIFFKSDTQLRDYITPKRTLYTNFGSVSNTKCSFENINVYSQEVPFYQWKLVPKSGSGYSIFGSQENDWFTNLLDSLINKGGFFKHKYQSLDRLLSSSRYVRTTNVSNTSYFKGYIYSVDGSGNLSTNLNSIEVNSGEVGTYTTGSPFYFYFGLKRGRSAYDKFGREWLNIDIE